MTKKHISFFSLKTQFENVGDALINRELVKLASLHSEVYIDLSRCPEGFRATLALDQVPNVNVVQGFGTLLVQMFKNRVSGATCYYFLSPGGYFGDMSVKQIPSRYVNYMILLLMALIGTKICHIGVSYERLGDRFARFLKRRAGLFHKHILRDERSRAYIQERGIHVDAVLPDLALNLFDTAPPQKTEIKNVAFSFRGDQFSDQYQQIKACAQGVVENLPKGTRFVAIAQVERDIPTVERLAKELEAENNITVPLIVSFDNIEQCTAHYAKMDMIVSNRLHALLLGSQACGHLLGCIGGGNNEKIVGLFAALGISSQLIDAEQPFATEAKAALDIACTTPLDGRLMRQELVDGFKTIYG